MATSKSDFSNGADIYSAGAALVFVVSFLVITTWLNADEADWPDLPPELDAVRESLKKYQDPRAAVRDGYLSTLGCVIYPDGNMGIHFVNMALMTAEPDPQVPQVLLYEPHDRGPAPRRRGMVCAARDGRYRKTKALWSRV